VAPSLETAIPSGKPMLLLFSVLGMGAQQVA
jgi:hypothetical protein